MRATSSITTALCTAWSGLVFGHQDAGARQRVAVVQRAHGLDDHVAGVELVVTLDFFAAQRPRAWHLAVEIVGMRRAHRRDRAAGLRPAGGVGRMRVHDAAQLRPGAVKMQVRGRVRRRLELAFDHAALQVEHDDVGQRHALVADAAGLDRHQLQLGVIATHVAPGEGDEAVARQREVGFEHALAQLAKAVREIRMSRVHRTSPAA